MEDVYVYQDNQSAILLENNGLTSVGKNSRHIKIESFFLADRVKDKELKIIYCPNKEFTAGLFTKPLQGTLFTIHQETVLGISQEGMLFYRNKYDAYVTQRGVTDMP